MAYQESPEVRSRIAQQIKFIRSAEHRHENLEAAWDRDKLDYFFALNGLSNFFDYAFKAGRLHTWPWPWPYPQVLDIGAGTTRGIAEIAESEIGNKLVFQATVLTRNPQIEKNLGFEFTHITSAEVLRGFSPESISAVISFNGIAYSAEPEIAARRIDEILIPGGAIKVTFKPKTDNSVPTEAHLNTFSTHDRFSTELKKLGYDVAVINEELQEAYGRPREVGANEDVMLAIKSGGKVNATARELLASDSGMTDMIMSMDGHY
jgi:SAM-dependent methyltransferase